MGTRSIIWVWYKGKWRVAQYASCDGYPEGQGIRIVKFLNNTGNGWKHDVMSGLTTEDTEMYSWGEWKPGKITNIEALKAAFDNDMTYPAPEGADDAAYRELEHIQKEARLLSPSEEVLKLSREDIMAFYFKNQLWEGQYDAPLVLGDTLDHNIGAYILGLVAHAAEKVPLEMAFQCVSNPDIKWQYVIDLDENLFEIYCGLEWVIYAVEKGRWDREPFLGRLRPRFMKSYTFDELVDKTRNDLVDDVDVMRQPTLPYEIDEDNLRWMP